MGAVFECSEPLVLPNCQIFTVLGSHILVVRNPVFSPFQSNFQEYSFNLQKLSLPGELKDITTVILSYGSRLYDRNSNFGDSLYYICYIKISYIGT